MDYPRPVGYCAGGGGFTFSAAVYLFRIERLEPLARPAVFVGFLGYTSAMFALAMDIGRPDRFWHPLVYWNVHSVLWEITWCVILYSTVLMLEFVPIIAETRWFDGWNRLRRFTHQLHKATPFFALVGMLLSLLHQSSLGATYGVLTGRAIWFKPSMPIMFILSAIAGGLALTLLATMVTGKLRQQRLVSVMCSGRLLALWAMCCWAISISSCGTGRRRPTTAPAPAWPTRWPACRPRPPIRSLSGGGKLSWRE
jgi:Ni/Fe-hydrogenase subunit HybB-like protein